MKRKIILPILLVAAVLGVVLASSGIGRNADAGNKHILVAFFSATGNTKSVAETAATALNADLFRIVPVEAYTEADLGYGADARVHREQSDPFRSPADPGSRIRWKTGTSTTQFSSATLSGAALPPKSSTPLQTPMISRARPWHFSAPPAAAVWRTAKTP